MPKLHGTTLHYFGNRNARSNNKKTTDLKRSGQWLNKKNSTIYGFIRRMIYGIFDKYTMDL
jgi:hypothetical protein